MKFLSNYLDFILEAVSRNEMRLHYSEEFRKLLTKISKKMDWAKSLLAAEDSNQISDIYTLIDVTDKNDTISFIQVNRILRSEPETKKYPDSDVYFLSRDITNDKSHDFWNKGRTEIGIGRWVRRVIFDLHKSSISDSEIEKFVNQYKAIFDGEDSSLELVSGEDIRKYYLHSNYESTKGQLGNSCMRYSNCQPYLDIYVKNTQVCQLLILRSDEDPEKIKGRALLWKIKIPENYKNGYQIYNDEYYLDRIYTINDSDRQLFQDWAEEKNIQHFNSRLGNNWRIFIQLGDFDYKSYPYMDSLMVYNPENKVLSSDEDLWPSSGFIKIQETGGGFISDDAVWSNYSDEWIQRSDAVYCENVDDYINSADAVYLEYKDIYAYPNEDVVWSEFHSESFYSDDCVYSELMSDNLYPDNDQVIEIRVDDYGNTDYVVKSRTDLYVEIDGDYYGRSTYVKDPYTGKYHFLDEKDEEGNKYSDVIYNKIVTELFGKNVSDHSEVKRLVYKRLIEIYKSGDNQKELEKIIEQSPKYKSLQVYWGLDKEQTPNANRLVELSFACLMSYTIMTRPINSIGGTSIRELISRVGELNSESSILYDRWQRTDSRIMKNSISVCKTIEWSNIPDIYKLYLLLSI
jgi:hypothetical protein